MKDKIYVPKSEWDELIKNWLITDTVIRHKNLISIVVREVFPPDEASLMLDHEFKTTVIQIKLAAEKGARKTGAAFLQGFTKPKLGTCSKPIAQDLLVSDNNQGQVKVLGAGGKFEFISPEGLVPATQKIVTIDGYAYSVGLFRQIFKRTELGKWEEFNNKGMPDNSVVYIKGERQPRRHMGFNDMDGPNENHMYAVGGHGEVMRYDGKRWNRCDFPSNEQLSTVTVGPDGTVYIGGEGGNLWKGKEDTWAKIYEGSSSILYNDRVWFDNKLWLSSDYQFLMLNGDKVERAKFGEEELPFSGHMDARDGLLVIASLHQVYAFDGKEWQCLVAPYEKD